MEIIERFPQSDLPLWISLMVLVAYDHFECRAVDFSLHVGLISICSLLLLMLAVEKIGMALGGFLRPKLSGGVARDLEAHPPLPINGHLAAR
jgi:hypothetical protein